MENDRRRNYQKELDSLIRQIQEKDAVPRLLLHCCCAPCSSYVLEYLTEYFEITLLYYNPNIFPETEYIKRINELKRLVGEVEYKNPVSFAQCSYDGEKFFSAVKGLEDCPEGSERCFVCYELRLREAAEAAKKGGFDYFTTTLSISPYKNAVKLCEIGERLAEEYGVCYLPSDFKKKGGYLRSIRLSEEYGLYRQDYCGCVYSKAERERKKAAREQAGT